MKKPIIYLGDNRSINEINGLSIKLDTKKPFIYLECNRSILILR